MKLIGLMYFLSFCGCLNAVPTNVTRELNTLRKIKRTNWNQSNTEFDPNVILDTPEMIKKAGYPAEAHVIMTEDGYLLTLHRIPGSNGSLPVLLLHGILTTSADWVLLGKDKALPYLLADQGYDVWLGNFRGNIYSKAHISLSPLNSTFWDFSFNEMGIYDLPAMITFITNLRSQPLHTYIGHSMGTTSFFIMASERPEIAQMVKMMISFAPAVFVNHVRSTLVQYLISISKELEMTIQLFFNGEFLQSDFVRLLLKYCCDQNIIEEIFYNVIFMIAGYDREQLNRTMLPIIAGHYFAGTSVKTLMHYVQGYQSGKFRQYDYDQAKNLMIYNAVEPPDYDLANITIPIALFYSKNDWIIGIEDVKKLYHLLPNVVDMYEVPWPNFNHVDFMWAKDAHKFVYERALKLMKEQNLNNTILIE